jgi:phage protein D
MAAAYRLYLDNTPADQAMVDRFGDIRVDQAIGVASEAELQLPVATDSGGQWSGQEEDFTQPLKRVRIEVKVGDGDFVPLIDGPIVANRFELKASPDDSRMTLVVHDDSVLLNRHEKVALFQDQAAHEIAEALISEYGLTPEVSAAPSGGSTLTRFVVQRGTDMQLLRQLARQTGMFAYVRPGPTPGTSTAVFAPPDLTPGDLPEILLLGPDRNVASFSIELDALRPFTATGGSVDILDKSVLTSEASAADLAPLGDEAIHDTLAETGSVLLARSREEQGDIDAAAQAAVDQSSWAISAEGEVDADRYAGVLSPYQVVSVAGIGGRLAGAYLVSRVTHLLSDASYKQKFALVRNARSAGGSGGAPAVPGGIL